MGILVMIVVGLMAPARANLPPAVGVCATARAGARGVDIPAGARVVSMGPREDGRAWACWVEGRTP
jgi:hypothetical protein